MKRTKLLNALIASYSQVSVIFPIVVAAPRYFAGTLDLGGLTQTAGAFGSVQGAMSWFVTSYSLLASWQATVDRLIFFRTAIAEARAEGRSGMQMVDGDSEDFSIERPELRLPDGRLLLDDEGVTLHRGESVVFTGRSGSGKSTLFRAFAGIWPFGGGRVKPGSGNALFLPQRPYFPQGTLRDMLAYPAATDSFTEAEFTQALDDVGMSALSPELDLRDAWSHRLSGGEQQRVALARALLVKPDWLFLDEATASLDPQSEHDLLEMLKARLPDTTMVSIAHRPEVAAVHAKEFVVLRDGDTPAHVATVIAEPI